jgi:YhcH/YjgK/YiaL family protein
MIVDTLENASLYFSLDWGIETGLQYLQRTDLNALSPGTYPIEGERIFCIVQNYLTIPPEEGFWEAHRRFIDIQFVVKGSEWIGYAPLRSLELERYDEAKDLAVLLGEGSYVRVPEGSFMILGPGDAHKPRIALGKPESVRKAVIKVACE